ncbi:MAG: hypothetical protein ABI551_22495, partial [Polyangiaceae bacterium]
MKDRKLLARAQDRQLALQAVTAEALVREIRERTGVEALIAEARKIVGAVHRERLGEPMPQVRRIVREAALSVGEAKTLAVVAEQSSAVDPFKKLVFAGNDGL